MDEIIFKLNKTNVHFSRTFGQFNTFELLVTFCKLFYNIRYTHPVCETKLLY